MSNKNSSAYITHREIEALNKTRLWNNSISVPRVSPEPKTGSTKFTLHATGYTDLNGRKYVALPENTDTNDPNIREKYNLF